jgi:hypothetical protein
VLITPDDLEEFQKRYFERWTGLSADLAPQIFNELVTEIEPRLAFTDPGGGLEWMETRTKTKVSIAGSQRGLIEHLLPVLIQLAKKYWRLEGPYPQRKFPFIANAALRGIAEHDWGRALAGQGREDSKTAALAAASVVEAIALDILERLSAADRARLRDHVNALPLGDRFNVHTKKAHPADWALAYMLVALGPKSLGVLLKDAHELGHLLRDARNYVHPAKARSEPPLTSADGRLAPGFADKAIEQVEAWTNRGAILVVP